MPFNRTILCVAVGFSLALLTGPSYGQLVGAPIFGPADVSTYGGDQEPNEGYFFQFDGLYWSISPPKTREVGYPGTRTVYYGVHPINDQDPLSDERIQSNTLNTAIFDSKFSPGARFEFGQICNGNGWFMSILQLRDQTQDVRAAAADMVFNDPVIGSRSNRLLQGNVNSNSSSPPVVKNLPVTFYDVLLENAVSVEDGIELNYLHRFSTCHTGGNLEMYLGARYLEFNDSFRVHTGLSPKGTQNSGAYSYLQESYWDTDAGNHIIGPQIGLRWFKKQGRWTLSAEGKFMAGVDYQNIHQEVSMGPHLVPGGVPTGSSSNRSFVPTIMSATYSTHVFYEKEFTPLIELRIEGRYQLTRSISFHAGWTGIWMDGIARASSLIDYTVPRMGIDMNDNRENVLLNGLTLGFDVNR
jgi:hypothetical protein